MFLHDSSICFALLSKCVALFHKMFLHSIFFAPLLFGGRWLRHNWRLEISDPTFILSTHPTPKSNHLSDFIRFYPFPSKFIRFIKFDPFWRYPNPLLSSPLIPLQRATTYLMFIHFINFYQFS